MFCEKCGKQLPDNAKFCTGCGAQLNGSAPSNPTPPPASTPTPSASIPTPPPAPPKPMPSPAYTPQPPHPAYAANVNQMGDFRDKPMSVGQYLGMFLLLCVPLLNIILIFVWAFSSTVNKNKKNFALSYLILAAIGLVLWLVVGSSIMAIINGMGGFNGMGL